MNTIKGSTTSEETAKLPLTAVPLVPAKAKEAMELLTSAVAYCEKAGLSVSGSSDGAGLLLYVPYAAKQVGEDGLTRLIYTGPI